MVDDGIGYLPSNTIAKNRSGYAVMELPKSLQVAATVAGILAAVATVFAAGFGVSYYFAPRGQLDKIKHDLRMQKVENDCRNWLLTHVINYRITILEEQENYVELDRSLGILQKMIESNTGTLSKSQKSDAMVGVGRLVKMEAKIDSYKTQERSWLDTLLQPTVLESGECRYKKVPQ